MALSASVAIITRNRPHLLEQCLECLKSQWDELLEVIVVDASDGLETQQMLAKYPQVRPVFIQGAANQIPRSRNEAIRIARGDVILFIDDDSMVQPGWLNVLLAHYQDPRVGGAGGLVLAPGEEPLPQNHIGRIDSRGTVSGTFNVLTPGPQNVTHLLGCNMSFRREILLDLGGFDPLLDRTNFRDETDVCARVGKAGYKLVYDPAAVVIHHYARKGAFSRDDQSDLNYRFSNAKNNAYFRLKNYFSLPTLLSIYLLGPARLLFEVIRGRQNARAAWADWTGRWSGALTYLSSRSGRTRENA
jgi:GT2 family glycosyltransferase